MIGWLELYEMMKRNFPANILVALVLGVVVGYFIGTFALGGAAGRAYGVTEFCGDGVRQGNEECDIHSSPCDPMPDQNGIGIYPAEKDCKVDCTFDVCQTIGSCGDGTKNGDEQCDGSLEGLTCEDLGSTGGTLVCGSTCQFDTSGCS